MATHELTLNLKKTNIAPPVITVHQGDSAEVLKAAIYDGDKKAALTGCKVHLMAAKPDHTYVDQQFTGISDNVATVTVDPAVSAWPGCSRCATCACGTRQGWTPPPRTSW